MARIQKHYPALYVLFIFSVLLQIALNPAEAGCWSWLCSCFISETNENTHTATERSPLLKPANNKTDCQNKTDALADQLIPLTFKPYIAKYLLDNYPEHTFDTFLHYLPEATNKENRCSCQLSQEYGTGRDFFVHSVFCLNTLTWGNLSQACQKMLLTFDSASVKQIAKNLSQRADENQTIPSQQPFFQQSITVPSNIDTKRLLSALTEDRDQQIILHYLLADLSCPGVLIFRREVITPGRDISLNLEAIKPPSIIKILTLLGRYDEINTFLDKIKLQPPAYSSESNPIAHSPQPIVPKIDTPEVCVPLALEAPSFLFEEPPALEPLLLQEIKDWLSESDLFRFLYLAGLASSKLLDSELKKEDTFFQFTHNPYLVKMVLSELPRYPLSKKINAPDGTDRYLNKEERLWLNACAHLNLDSCDYQPNDPNPVSRVTVNQLDHNAGSDAESNIKNIYLISLAGPRKTEQFLQTGCLFICFAESVRVSGLSPPPQGALTTNQQPLYELLISEISNISPHLLQALTSRKKDDAEVARRVLHLQKLKNAGKHPLP